MSTSIRTNDCSLKQREQHSSDEREADGNSTLQQVEQERKRDKEFTIDEDFFHSVIMPGVHSTVVVGLRQEHVPLFNLVFAMEIAIKKGTISDAERNYFFKEFTRIKNFHEWRLNQQRQVPNGFLTSVDRTPVPDYPERKRDLQRLYPTDTSLFEQLESLSKDITYADVSSLLYKKLFKSSAVPLIKQLNIGLALCPDIDWRSKVCQFMYEELQTIFDFSEDFAKLHSFIKTASWHMPVALLTQNSINIVNTVCSIASYYGVGLEVLRTDSAPTVKRKDNYYREQEISHRVNRIETQG